MVSTASQLDLRLHGHLLHGLADGSRLRILTALRGGERRVSDLVSLTGLSQPNVSQHLRCLWGCGLVAREPRGREVLYRPVEGIEELFAALDRLVARAGTAIGSCALTAATIDADRPREGRAGR